MIQIEERKPIAILQLEELYYIDAKGVIFSPAERRDGYNFPFLTGLTRQALKRIRRIKGPHHEGPGIFEDRRERKGSPLEEISEIHMYRSFGIDCFTRANGLEVKMGKDSFGEKDEKVIDRLVGPSEERVIGHVHRLQRFEQDGGQRNLRRGEIGKEVRKGWARRIR